MNKLTSIIQAATRGTLQSDLSHILECSSAQITQDTTGSQQARLIPLVYAGRQYGYLRLIGAADDPDERVIELLSLLLHQSIDVQSYIELINRELREPLNGIIGMTSVLHASAADAQRAHLDTIQLCSIQVTRVLNNVLDFCKLNSGGLVVRASPYNLRDLIAPCRRIIASSQRDARISLRGTTPAHIIIDGDKFVNILMNTLIFVMNTTHSHNRIRISVYTHSSRVVVVIQDNDTTRAGSLDEGAFEFNMGVNAARTQHLDLAVAKKMCDLIGGAIAVVSEPDFGTKFEIQIPYQPVVEALVIVDDASNPITANVVRALAQRDIAHETRTRLCDDTNMRYVRIVVMIAPTAAILDETAAYLLLYPNIASLAIGNAAAHYNLTECMHSFRDGDFARFLDSNMPHMRIQPIESLTPSPPVNTRLMRHSSPWSDTAITRVSSLLNTNAHVLIADPVQHNASMLRHMLNKMGFRRVNVVSSGTQAVRIMLETDVDVLITDAVVRDFAALQHAITGIAEHRRPQLIMTTTASAHARPGWRVLTKPITRTNLEACLKTVC